MAERSLDRLIVETHNQKVFDILGYLKKNEPEVITAQINNEYPN